MRSALFFVPGWLPWWVLYAFDSEAGIAAYADGDLTLIGISVTAGLLLYCTMRRRNGYAGIHDLASGTRVVRTRTHERRPALSMTDEPLPEVEVEQQIGPYQVLGPLDERTHELLLAYDAQLLRKVWIRKCPTDAPPVAPELRGLARIGRLRWLGGERDGDGGWDAYEAQRGQPLVSLVDTRQPWNAVRFWLSDLAEELSASLKDRTLGSGLELDQVWITDDGRAKLLDFPAPGLDPERRTGLAHPPASADASTARSFLKRVAIAALEGEILSPEDVRNRTVAAPLPLPARSLLNELDGSMDTTIPTQEFKSFIGRPASVSLGRRVGALAACWLLPILTAAPSITEAYRLEQFVRAHREIGELSDFVVYYRFLQELESESDKRADILFFKGLAGLQRLGQMREAIEIFVVDRFRSTITDSALWSNPTASEFVDIEGQSLLEGFVRAHPDLTPEQLATAKRRIEPVLEQLRVVRSSGYSFSQELLFDVGAFLMAFVVLPSLISALLIRNSLLLRMLEIAIVTKRGEQASRLRVLSRNVILWSITLSALGVLIFLASKPTPTWMTNLLIVYSVVTLFTAERGLHDRLAGTWLVPNQ